MDDASTNGHLEVVQWLHIHEKAKCTIDAMKRAAMYEGFTIDALDDAACNGHLEVVRWLHDNRNEGCSGRAI
ncbi:hypothetical protein PHMEG_00036612 [Phytophthora megakarya]|uniref:Uncharacterized protein n=1 Tax=Phytophthora megakarya TaxID=4795 RepID=A0A225UKT4_9STRA|nr:hypothetical protein PHMEG_00036612 [Phytophthora megakarya]